MLVTLSSIALASRPVSHVSVVSLKHLLTLYGLVIPARSVTVSFPCSYRAQTLGWTFNASLIMMGVCGLWCFIVGYARVRKDLIRLASTKKSLFYNAFSMDVPDGIAVIACLAVMESKLLERLCECVFATHGW